MLGCVGDRFSFTCKILPGFPYACPLNSAAPSSGAWEPTEVRSSPENLISLADAEPQLFVVLSGKNHNLMQNIFKSM